MDTLRANTNMTVIEMKFLKDKMKMFEGTVTQTTQFGFGGFKTTQQ